jgi:tRNA nucleotidyltransferase (CCA-adding enzyme)
LTAVEDVLRRVVEQLRPLQETLEKTEDVTSRLVQRLEDVFGRGLVSVEGSFAKGTMVRGREESDIFIHFRPGFPVDEACRRVVEEGVKAVVGVGGAYRLRYASHPYVEGFVDGIRVNIVPCYDAEYGRWITPVDRTPYHTAYVKKNLPPGGADHVRLLKAFLMNDNLYGAELKTRGFSGYVCELLIIRFGSFTSLLQAASKWRPPVVLGEGKPAPDTVLHLPDPVDPSRNTAAAISLTTLSNFILKSKLFLTKPSEDYFVGDTGLEDVVEERSFLGLVFSVPEQPPDVLWGELNHTVEGLARGLNGLGFTVLRYDRWAEEKTGVMVFELETNILPPVVLHRGPPVWSGNAERFIAEQMLKKMLLAPPWVSGDRLYSLLRRRHRDAAEALQHLIQSGQASVSKHLQPHLRNAKTYTNIASLMETLTGEGKHFLKEFVRTCPKYIATYISSLSTS